MESWHEETLPAFVSGVVDCVKPPSKVVTVQNLVALCTNMYSHIVWTMRGYVAVPQYLRLREWSGPKICPFPDALLYQSWLLYIKQYGSK